MRRNKSAILASSLTAITLLIVSCAPAATPTTVPKTTAAPPKVETPAAKAIAPSATAKPGPEQPKYGGIVNKALNRDVASFDLHREQGADASSTIFNVYQGLIRLHPIEHQKIVPELAERWETSADGKSYTFKFYKGIEWHDGKPFTMDDVVYSLQRMQNPKAFKTISPRGEGLLAAMESVEKAGEDTVKITTKFPSASFLLSIATGWIGILPKHILEPKGDMRRDLVGTGPFQFKAFNPNVSLELAKNPKHHIKGLPYLDGIRFYTIKDASTRLSAFRTGKVELTFVASAGLTAAEAEIVRREMADKAQVYDHDALTSYVVTINTQRKPWDDVRVRKAANLAYDRQAAIKVNGKGSIGSLYPSTWSMKPEELAATPGWRQPKDADITEAKRLLGEAGFPRGFKTSLLILSGGAQERLGVVAKDQLAKIGIDAELTILEQAVLYERTDRRAFDLFQSGWTHTIADPDETLFTYYATDGSRNRGDFSDKDIDDLIGKQARTFDVKAREAIVREIDRRLLELAPGIITFWELYQAGAWKQVRNFSPGPGVHPWGKLDHVWLAK